MNLYEVTWKTGSFKIVGKIEAEDREKCLTSSRDRFLKEIGLSPRRHPIVRQLKANCDKRYKVKMVSETFATGEKREHIVKRIFKTRERASDKCESLRGTFPGGRIVTEIIEVSA